MSNRLNSSNLTAILAFLSFHIGYISAFVLLIIWNNVYGVQGLSSVVYNGVRIHHFWLGLGYFSASLFSFAVHRIGSNPFWFIVASFLISFGGVLMIDDTLWHTILCQPNAGNNYTCPAPFF